MASDESQSDKYKKDHLLDPLTPIEFGFVLLPDEAYMGNLNQLVHHTSSISSSDTSKAIFFPPEWGEYHDEPLRIAHMSLGQYGILALELDTLEKIARSIAEKTTASTEGMSPFLSITDENIFFECQNINEKTNSRIIELYKVLRSAYQESCETKFMIAQALLEKYRHKDEQSVKNFINQHFQNWGTPEGAKLRPYITLLYNTILNAAQRKALNEGQSIKDLLNHLSNISFTYLAIVRIDMWGNPLENSTIAKYRLQ